MKGNRRGQNAVWFLPFLLVGVVLVFVFAIVAVPMADVSERAMNELKDNDEVSNENHTVSKINQVQGLVTPAFDQLVFILLIAVLFGIILISIFSDFHPAIVVTLILAVVFITILSGLMVNVYDDATQEDPIQNKSEEFTLTNAVMGEQFPIIVVVAGGIGVIILLAKRGGQTSPV